MAYFDKAIPPGGEGKISLTVRTKGYQGRISKKARVFTNDPLHKMEVLSIRAYVKVPIRLSRRSVYLYGIAGQTVTQTIKIEAERDKPLKLEPVHFDLNSKVTFHMEEVAAGKIFLIHFTSIPGPAEGYHGILKLKTNYPERPEITIRITGRFKS